MNDLVKMARELLALHATPDANDPDAHNVAFEQKALALARAVIRESVAKAGEA